MGELVIRNGVKIIATLASGTGDEILTRDSSTNALGSISAIDTTVFVSKTLPSANIYVGNGSNVATAVAMSGDIAIDNAGTSSIVAGVIVNADVNAAAAIALSKLAATTASRALVSDGSGVITPAATTATELGYVSGVTSAIQTQLNAKQATITGGATTITSADLTINRALIANGSGKVAVSAVTDTELGYVSGVTSALQTQIDTKQPDLQFQDEGVNEGTSGGVTTVDFTGAGVTASEAAGVLTVNIPGTANGLPTGGTAGQYLNKIDGTDYNAQWSTLTISAVTDITASAAEINALTGAGVSAAEMAFLGNVTGDIQAQLDAKLSKSLSTGYIWTGVAAVAAQLAPGSNGDVLTIAAGVPAWVTPGVGGTVTSVAASGGTTGMSWTGTPITTSGTLTLTGTLVAANGGTGFASYTVGDILYASTTTAFTRLNAGTAGYILTSGGAGVAPTWAAGAISGLTATRIPFAASATSLDDDSNLTWDDTNKILTVGVARFFSKTNPSAYDDLFIGTAAGNSAISGTYQGNIGIGHSALSVFNTSGGFNVAIGHDSMPLLESGGQLNVAIGGLTLEVATTAEQNTAVGHQAMNVCVDGISNSAFGIESLKDLTSGDFNIGIGDSGGINITTGSYNIALGYRSWVPDATLDGQLNIQNAIYGSLNTGTDATTSSGIIGFYTQVVAGSWQKATFIGNMAAQGTAIADGIVLYAKDSSDGSANSTLALYLEQAVEAIGTFTATHKLKIWINGTEYWVQLDAV